MSFDLWYYFCSDHPHRYYSTSIFCSIDVPSYVATAIIGTINFLTTLLAIFLVDKVLVYIHALHVHVRVY